jgi:hypothetical protein
MWGFGSVAAYGLTLTTDESKWLLLYPGCFTPEKRVLGVLSYQNNLILTSDHRWHSMCWHLSQLSHRTVCQHFPVFSQFWGPVSCCIGDAAWRKPPRSLLMSRAPHVMQGICWKFDSYTGIQQFPTVLNPKFQYSAFGTWWLTVTHGRGSEGDRCEWSG